MENRIFYAIAYERQVSKTEIKPGIEYTHASNAAAARYNFFADPINQKGRVRIVGIAPVVGYFQDDKTGQITV